MTGLIKVLLDAGADPNVESRVSRSAYSWATVVVQTSERMTGVQLYSVVCALHVDLISSLFTQCHCKFKSRCHLLYHRHY